MNLNALPVNGFDVAILVFLGLGLFRGRKHGLSEELLVALQWMAVAVGCALVYQPLGKLLAQSSPFSLLSSYIMVYIVCALVILGGFALLKRYLGGKLLGSDIFGRGEYYLGMAAGVVRFSCILIAILALLNSRYYSPAEVREIERFQNDVYGSTYFPGWQAAQSTVFERSLSGPWIREHLGMLLIEPTPPEDKAFHQKEANWAVQ